VTCNVCGFNFEEAYGERGKDYIAVHHLTPVSTFGKTTKVDPKSDMIVLCSNCHRMIHRRKDDVLTPEELTSFLEK
jgi:5-methylcytosine-specific restriction protein A